MFSKRVILSNISFERLKKDSICIENNLIGSDNDICLTVDSLIDISNAITGSNNFTLRKVNVKPYGYDKMYMDKDLIEDKLYQLKDQFNEKRIIIKIFILHYSTTYIYFMTGLDEYIGYYLLAISVRGIVVNEGI